MVWGCSLGISSQLAERKEKSFLLGFSFFSFFFFLELRSNLVPFLKGRLKWSPIDSYSQITRKNWNEACVFVWFFFLVFLSCFVLFVFCFFCFFVTGLCAEPSEFDRAERGKPGAWRAQRGPSWPPRQPSSRGAKSGWAVARSGHRLSQGKPKWCPPSPTPLAHRCRLCHETRWRQETGIPIWIGRSTAASEAKPGLTECWCRIPLFVWRFIRLFLVIREWKTSKYHEPSREWSRQERW